MTLPTSSKAVVMMILTPSGARRACGFFESPDFLYGRLTVHFRHHDIHADQVVGLPALLGSAESCHRLFAVNRDVAFPIVGEKRLQAEAGS